MWYDRETLGGKMTDEQIFELMDEHFHLGCIHDSSYVEYVGQANDFVKFARAIYKEGYEMARLDNDYDKIGC
jgi:hypothetical protein